MKPKLIALNLLLVASLGAIVWHARITADEAKKVRQGNVNVPVKPVPAPPLAPVPKPDAPAAAKYVEVADKNLFSKDRNATVIVEPVKVEAPKPMPALPFVYGVMGLPSGAKAIMAEKSGAATRPVRAGDSIGEFKVVSLDTRDVVFDWDGKRIAKKIEDLVDRSATLSASAGQQSGAPSGPAAAAAPTPPVNSTPTSKDVGIELTPTTRGCKPGDTSPVGAVVDGYRKEGTPGPFGLMGCRWVKQ